MSSAVLPDAATVRPRPRWMSEHQPRGAGRKTDNKGNLQQ